MGHTTNVASTSAQAPAPVVAQSHSKFKAFVGSALGGIIEQIDAFTKDGKVAPKSIGVEYLESSSQLVVTLGHRDDEAGYPVKITSKSLGKLAVEPGAIESAMEAAAADIPSVMCHEFYVTGEGEFVMVIMSHG